ncbi:hypothetical protein K469DRAFT_681852 [Zopfia rhizophila CBS 207.26]|uniref:Uncharacterized protein n=1 Tax=Zopfia rhizophila CBS 207.26 TaxID=1314779 RepID=A0A6A6EZK1_9PEZI|nr:hypothetical protein K469DRAFT_681852 [Zopfia rhizophila CBS 207.26]
MKKMIREHYALLQQTAKGTQSLHKACSAKAPESVFEEGRSRGSVLDFVPNDNDKPDSLEFEFDHLILNSGPYKKTFTNILCSPVEDDSDDAQTIIGQDWPDKPHMQLPLPAHSMREKSLRSTAAHNLDTTAGKPQVGPEKFRSGQGIQSKP